MLDQVNVCVSQLYPCHDYDLTVRKCTLVEKVDSRHLFSQVHHRFAAGSQRFGICSVRSFHKKKMIIVDDCVHL